MSLLLHTSICTVKHFTSFFIIINMFLFLQSYKQLKKIKIVYGWSDSRSDQLRVFMFSVCHMSPTFAYCIPFVS